MSETEPKTDEEDDGDAGYGTPPETRRVIWEMTYQKDGTKEMIFESELALAALLMSDQVFLNDHWWKKDWPEEARNITSMNANCNDVFAWGCADAEEVPYRELRSVYDHWVKDPSWGIAIWCMKIRKEMPQGPVGEAIKKVGIWDFDELQKEFGLRANCYDGLSGIHATLQYETYAKWAKEQGNEPLPFDAKWWAGWKEYIAAVPDWRSDDWKAELERRRQEWKQTNGWLDTNS